ncbi:MAG: hypothetical protein JO148_04240 [Acidimicrobiia bacterium]|nr:hypothetical protein [Acidimicrobiia bacterium]
MALVMATTVWSRLQAGALDAVRGEAPVDDEMGARRLLAMCGGDRRMVLATRLRLAALAARTPDELNPRRALALVDRAIALADGEGLWHPVFTGAHP